MKRAESSCNLFDYQLDRTGDSVCGTANQQWKIILALKVNYINVESGCELTTHGKKSQGEFPCDSFYMPISVKGLKGRRIRQSAADIDYYDRETRTFSIV